MRSAVFGGNRRVATGILPILSQLGLRFSARGWPWFGRIHAQNMGISGLRLVFSGVIVVAVVRVYL